jgi:hypothetical protein
MGTADLRSLFGYDVAFLMDFLEIDLGNLARQLHLVHAVYAASVACSE